MSDGLTTLEDMVGAALARRDGPTPDEIRRLISDVRRLPQCDGVDNDAAELLARRFEERLGVTMTLGSMLKQQDFTPWLDAAREEIEPYYWKRYSQHLALSRFPPEVVSTLDRTTDRVLGLLENPSKAGPWDRRGMVVGYVQSGKTAHYTGLTCKAADAGYKLIVVVAGLHNNLRNQTQERIDEGFVGRDSTKIHVDRRQRLVGVGKINATHRPVTFTTARADFNKNSATQLGVALHNLTVPAVFVIKKNTNTLRNLLEWLKEHSARLGSETVHEPMLLIDDEADNASINISHSRGEVSRINGQIRDLLKMFDRSCYVGYTATPFANIFIDPDSDDEMLGEDLFPRDFIVSLNPPSNYFGPTRVFGDGSTEVIRYIEDHHDILPLRHTIDTPVTELPPSLVDALRVFVLSKAIRLARGHSASHCSMLVNVSRFVNVQGKIANRLHERLRDIQSSVRVNGALSQTRALGDPEMNALHRLWRREFKSTGTGWDIVQGLLHKAAAQIRVAQVNSQSSDSLSYKDHRDVGLNVVAVGGYSLSRGLTLEGLTTSYFLRNSIMYDTLMQMGRWFGYRPGYDDLCRVWMPEEAEGWYAHITESIELLRDELRSMEAVNATPQEFGLKVRSHPDTLIITARNKMGSGERVVQRVGLGKKFVETAILRRDPTSLGQNLAAARLLAKRLAVAGCPVQEAERCEGGWLVRKAPVDPVFSFLREFQNHAGSMLTDGSPIRRYIKERENDELSHWDILFTSIASDTDTLRDESLGVSINCQRRSAGKRSDERTLLITEKQRVASRGVEKTGLSRPEIERVEQLYKEENPGRTNYPDHIYRAARTYPLLIVHLLRILLPDKGGPDERHPEPVVAWSISFPKTAREEARVEYVVTPTWLHENYATEVEDDEGTDEQ